MFKYINLVECRRLFGLIFYWPSNMSMQYSWATRTPDFVLTLSDTDAMRSGSGSHSSEENLFFPVSAHVALVCLLWMYPQCDDVGFLIIFMGESYLLHSKHINLFYFILPSLCQCSPNVSEIYQKPIYHYLANVTLVCLLWMYAPTMWLFSLLSTI